MAVSLQLIGDVRAAMGDLHGALAIYEEDLNISRAMAEKDPQSALWRNDVALSLISVGEMRMSLEDHAGALRDFEESLTLNRELVALDPGNSDWEYNLLVALWRVASARETGAAEAWGEVIAMLEVSKGGNLSAEETEEFLAIAREELAASQAD